MANPQGPKQQSPRQQSPKQQNSQASRVPGQGAAATQAPGQKPPARSAVQSPGKSAAGMQRPASSASTSTTRQAGFFQVQLRDRQQFSQFRTEDLDRQGRIQRVAGQRANQSWADQELRISKECAHVENHRLVPDTEEARSCLSRLSGIEHVGGDVFRAQVPQEAGEKQGLQKQAEQEAGTRQAQGREETRQQDHQQSAKQASGQQEQSRPSQSLADALRKQT